MVLGIIRIAVRNITRNTRRSLITATAVLIGTLFIILARAAMNGFNVSIVNGFTETQAGDLQIHRPEYLESNEALPLDLSFEVDERLRKMLGEVPEIDAYSGRIAFSGMISNGEDTTLFVGVGVDPANEYKVCPRNRDNILPGGGPVSEAQSKGVVIGRALAEALKAEVGSDLTILVNAKAGNLTGFDVTVVGIAEFMLPGMGNKVIHLPLKTAQHYLGMENQVTEAVINVTDLQQVAAVGSRLNTLLNTTYKDAGLKANTWMDVGQLYVNAIELQDAVLVYVVVVLFIVMIAGIVNTMLMSVFERVREIGTMMAVGVRRSRIVLLFMFESVVLGVVGATVGVGTGYLIVRILGRTGLNLGSIGSSKDAIIYPYIPFSYMAMVTLVALLTAVVAALYPATRAARMRPAEALRTL